MNNLHESIIQDEKDIEKMEYELFLIEADQFAEESKNDLKELE